MQRILKFATSDDKDFVLEPANLIEISEGIVGY